MYIDNGNATWNKNTFDSLIKSKLEIEETFGGSLIWDRLDDKRASVIRFFIEQYGLQEKEKWAQLQDQMIETMIKFEKIFQPLIRKMG